MNLKNIFKTCTIFLSVISFVPLVTYSQSLILSSAKTGDYSSPYSIILAPGFSSSGPFRAFIEAQPVNTSAKGYLVEEVIKVEGIKDDSQIYQLGAAQRQTTRTYVDGFGRPTQQIIVKGSASQKDIVQNMVYDNLGTQTRSYLPYAASDGGGSFRTNAMNEQSAFYANGAGDKVADDSKPYSEQVFDNSPLQRMMISGGVGNGYQPGEHVISLSYRINVASDGVHRWNFDGSSASDYGVGSLSVVVSTDQQGNQSTVFKDNAGNIVLKRQQLDGNISGQTVAWLDTYYVYDDLGKIRYVVPPKAVSILQAATDRNLNQGSVDKLLFHYVYDDKGRTVERTVPGGATMYMIYDPYNRLVMAQDGNLRASKQWNYIKYDSRNVPISQGIYTNTDYTSRTAMQSYVSGLPYSTYFEERNGDSSTGYYTNASFPTSSIEPLGYSYFNDYDLDGNGTADYNYVSQGLSGEENAVSNIRGMATIVRKRTIGSGLDNIWLTSVIFYNKRGIAIQTLSNNQLNAAVDNTKTVVSDFTGKPLISKTVRIANTVSTTVLTTMGYDHMDRVLTVDEKVNTNPTLRVASYEYNEIGQLVDKKLNSTNSGASYLQSVDFRYSIRGQMLSINNSSLSVDDKNDDSNDVFGMQFSYDQADAAIGNTPYYNGMISAVKWKSITPMATSPDERSYKFSYDKLYRLTSANYQEKSGSSWGSTGAFDEKDITYDHNGNILTLKRNAKIGGAISEIDNLNYTYIANQLSNITDAQAETNSNFGFRNLTASTVGYEYDSDGSLIHDTKKGLQLNYNVFNKTSRITMTGSVGRYIIYTYDAAGSLLRKQVYDNNALVKTTDYIEGYIYENNVFITIWNGGGKGKKYFRCLEI